MGRIFETRKHTIMARNDKNANWAAGVDVVLHGAEHLDPTRGAVYVSNHVSWFDIFAVAAILPRYTFVAKPIKLIQRAKPCQFDIIANVKCFRETKWFLPTWKSTCDLLELRPISITF